MLNYSFNFMFLDGFLEAFSIIDNNGETVFNDGEGKLDSLFIKDTIKTYDLRDCEYHVEKTTMGRVKILSLFVGEEVYERALSWVLSYYQELLLTEMLSNGKELELV